MSDAYDSSDNMSEVRILSTDKPKTVRDATSSPGGLSPKTDNMSPGKSESIAPTAFGGMSLSPGEPSVEIKSKPCKFTDFPAEVRNNIVRASVSQPVSKYLYSDPHLTMSVAPPSISQVCREFRDQALAMYYSEREFSLHVPRDSTKVADVESLQEEVMQRWYTPRYPGEPSQSIASTMEKAADEVEAEFDEDLEYSDDGYYHLVESIRVVFKGRFRINCVEGASNWEPTSFIIGFRAFNPETRPRLSRNSRYRINASGTMDWEDFAAVRRTYARALRRLDVDIENIDFNDVLLHPAVQHIVKELCLLGAAGAPAMEWVEIIAADWDSPTLRSEVGLPGYEWDSLDTDRSPRPSEMGSPPPDQYDDDDDEEEEEEEEEEEKEQEDYDLDGDEDNGQDQEQVQDDTEDEHDLVVPDDARGEDQVEVPADI